jgi:nucleoside-diphosphate-sugar epimerase
VISRIHIEDLAGIILSIFDRGKLAKSTYVVGDSSPSSIKEVVDWLCSNYDLPQAKSQELSASNPTLRGNRAIDASGILSELAYRLRYADYKQGYTQCMDQSAKFSD